MTTHTKTDARFTHGLPDPDAPAAPDDPGRARARRGDRNTLTETVIGRLRAAPLGRRVSHLDSVVPGLVLRVTDRGVKTWYVVTKFRGETLHYRIGAWPGIGLATQKNADGTETMGARDLARDALSKIASGVDPRKHRAKPGRAFGVIAAEFLLSPGEGGAAGKPSEYETTRS